MLTLMACAAGRAEEPQLGLPWLARSLDKAIVMHCPDCQADNPASAKFCNECGARLPRRCPVCAHVNLLTARFCGECGASLAGPAPVTHPSRAEPADQAALAGSALASDVPVGPTAAGSCA